MHIVTLALPTIQILALSRSGAVFHCIGMCKSKRSLRSFSILDSCQDQKPPRQPVTKFTHLRCYLALLLYVL
ncbi:hypothetical protein F4819DRAFT_455963 [Hypoxylon fuscum]|nr:hypothetical protein F4819DRAFT_455963 [Hypoxylon fuscum]